MWTDRFTSVFAVLSLLALAIVVVVAVLALARWRQPESAAAASFDRLQPVALWIAWLTAALMTFGSLFFALGAEYFSLSRRYFPNTLGWYQCICVIPLSVVLLIAAIRKDRSIWQYTTVPVLVGLIIAAYNTQLQALTTQPSTGTTADPAAQRIVWKFGFVSLPLMAAIGFVLIGLMLIAARPSDDDGYAVAEADADGSGVHSIELRETPA